MASTNPFTDVFQKKYNEFAVDLKATLPELNAAIEAAIVLPHKDRLEQFKTNILPSCSPTADCSTTPGEVLPGVKIPQSLWTSLGDKSQSAILEYMRILSFCFMYESVKEGAKGAKSTEGNAWTESFLNSWKDKLSGIDFDSLSKKLSGILGGIGPAAFPKLPERLLKGHLAKLAEELIREFKPEDFGLTPEELAACDTHPARAFELLTEVYTKKPEILQNAIKRIASRLQQKIARGEIRPEQIAAEAEELMKDFSENTAFTELMESFKGVFNMEDPEVARQAGRPEDARRSIVRDRLRKKLDANKNGCVSKRIKVVRRVGEGFIVIWVYLGAVGTPHEPQDTR